MYEKSMTEIVSIFFTLSITGGLLSSIAAFYGRYFVLPSFLTGPKTCKMEAGGCQVLFRTPRASLFGVPNSFLGLVFYILIIAGLWMGWPSWLLLLGASFALFTSVWLGISLLRNKLECRICWTGHIANLILWILLLFRH